MKSEIIIVDDTPDNLHILMGILNDQGYEIRVFSEGAFALESARSTTPDLILLDIKWKSWSKNGPLNYKPSLRKLEASKRRTICLR